MDLKALNERQKNVKPATVLDIFKRIFTGGMPAIEYDQEMYQDDLNFIYKYESGIKNEDSL